MTYAPYPAAGSRVELWEPEVDDKPTEAQDALTKAIASGDITVVLLEAFNLKLELLGEEAEIVSLGQRFYGPLEQAGEILTSRCNSQTDKATIPLADSERDFLTIALNLEKAANKDFETPEYVQKALNGEELSKEDWKHLGKFVLDHRESDTGKAVIPQRWSQQSLTALFTTVNQRYDRLPDEITQAIRGLIGSR